MSLFLFEVKYYFKNVKEAIYIYSFFISIILLAPFGLHGVHLSEIQILAPVILWIALALATMLGGANLFQRDHDQGRLEAYQLLPGSMEMRLLAKWAAFYISLIVPLLLLLPAVGILLNLNLRDPMAIAMVTAGAAGMSVVVSLASALMVGLDRAGAVLGLVMLPLLVPIVIFGADPSVSHLIFLCGFTAFMLPVYAVAGASVLRASN